MPFTLYHFGPAVLLGLPIRKFIHLPTFILSSVIIDIEPFIVLFLNLDYPLHGYFHTILFGVLTGIPIGYIMYRLEKYFSPIYRLFYLTLRKSSTLTPFITAAILGIMLHIVLDAPLYEDIKPFYPLMTNPLYNPSLSIDIYNFCLLTGMFGILYYFVIIISNLTKKY